MDRPDLDREAHGRALRGLGRINWVSLSASILWPAIVAVARREGSRTIRVLDLATGGGDVPIRLAARARRAGLDLDIQGCDVSPTAVAFAAAEAERRRVSAGFFRLDVLADPLPDGFDLVTCSLFLHHLRDEDAVRLLGKMAGAARSSLAVNDLVRSTIGYGLALAGCRLLSRSPIVHHDGPASVRAAFTTDEVRRLSDRAGLAGARIQRRWPSRFLLSWSRRPS